MKRILFVDDEVNVLTGLQRMLRPMRDVWEMEVANGGEQALRALVARPADVIVSDMRMPGMDGVQLLTEVKRLYPETVRIILSGHSDQETSLRSVGPAHQFLNKPCSAEALKSTIDRACVLHDRLRQPELKKLVSQLGSLPSLPTLYSEVLAEIRSPNGSLESVGRIVAKDMAMTAKVLQLVNSAFFGVRQPITDPALAARFLGLETLKALVLSVHVFSTFERDNVHAHALAKLWADCTRIGAFARRVARAERATAEQTDQAFFAGMLCEIGVLVLLANRRQDYARVLERVRAQPELDVEQVETELLGASHSDVGAYLLGLWGLPNVLVEAVAFHRKPSRANLTVAGPAVYVHAALAILRGLDSGDLQVETRHLDRECLEQLGLGARIETWRSACVEMIEDAE